MPITYTYSQDGSKSVSLQTRDNIPGVVGNVTADSNFGSIVSSWNADYANKTADQKSALDKIRNLSSGTFAVKYHIDYAKVLEDALQKSITDAATKVLFYAGQVDLDQLDGNKSSVADLKTFLGANFTDGSRLGAYFKVKAGTTLKSGVVSIGSGAEAVSLAVGDQFVVSADGIDKIDSTDPSVAAADSTIEVSYDSATQTHSVAVSATYKSSVTSAIETSLNTAKAYTDAETTARTAAVAAEATARSAADAQLATDLAAEVARATAAEAANATADAVEVAARQAADDALGTRIDDEASARAAQDTVLDGKITTEATARQNADIALGARIDTEIVDRTAADAVLDTAYKAADAAIDAAYKLADSQLDAAYKAADTQITADLQAEVTRATAAEQVLTTNLAAEVTRATAAEAAEASARTSADTALGARITTVAAAFDASIKSAADRLKILEAFVYATEQFVEMSTNGSTILDFSGSFAAWPSSSVVAVETSGAGPDFMAA